MKKLLTLSLLLLMSSLAYGQIFLRAKGLALGKKDLYTQEVVWPSEFETVNVLIEVEENKVTIHSQLLQVYRKVNMVIKTENLAVWYCLDSRGEGCNFKVITLPDFPGTIFIAVEYNDYTWIYATTRE